MLPDVWGDFFAPALWEKKCKIGFDRGAVLEFGVLARQVTGADPSYSFGV